MKIFMTGGSGFVGAHLSSFLLNQGHVVTATGSSPLKGSDSNSNYSYIQADTTRKGPWQNAVAEADTIINLAGRNIFKRWSSEYKKAIYQSRILTTRHLAEALSKDKIITFCSTSAAGYYGDREDEHLTEKSSPGDDFLSSVCRDWEEEAFSAKSENIRVATMRFGVVLGKGGGALAQMVPAFKLFAGGSLGTGLQWFPWIHILDLISAINFIIETPGIEGPVNVCAPNPVRYSDFARALARSLKRPAFMKTPQFMIRLAMGEMGLAILNSQRAEPEKLEGHGFTFKYPNIDKALLSIVGQN